MGHTHFFCFLYTICRPFDLRRRSRSPGFVLCALHFSGNKKANPEDGRRFTRTTLSAPASGPSCDRSSTQARSVFALAYSADILMDWLF